MAFELISEKGNQSQKSNNGGQRAPVAETVSVVHESFDELLESSQRGRPA